MSVWRTLKYLQGKRGKAILGNSIRVIENMSRKFRTVHTSQVNLINLRGCAVNV